MSMHMEELNRRGAVAVAAALATGGLVNLGGLLVPSASAAQGTRSRKPGEGGKDEQGGDDEDVSATEDLMREHGVLRRTLIVYAELSERLRSNTGRIDPGALADAAKLFREFGEDYHEHTLEEQHVFPEVRKGGGPNAKLVEVLLIQHQRGREITDYLYRIGSRGQIGGDAEPLARALASMTRMYQAHAAFEDTVVFPAWKKTQSKQRLGELAEKFEDIEKKRFGKDGFDEAIERISKVEQALGLADLAVYTAPSLPR
ncbi:hemerythrin domain-containing protein [Methylobacterium nodulans]|uniref:Hemerythrin HHE cation binding domain protein n=1 Tax=Methylobacterium nodulans (strain LMG 21967 / CNCM I-2342 / ORS 2060) TaxID=460265 RepID=B8IJJ2_METNO|nr:hemerythrin domain-containing protein [Methylobacterium nodulans]ACL58040.1 Hemerythrin HHE cation binding domain protein [Methylobacterium nodulans ORS 2060]